ncbi:MULTISPECIES: hypothetical protein [Alphaproteobacteria]|uniref:hypothetical protein n=1 Tax=Alphaproteobacteria TaxID=28211 RepID=UPI00262C6AF4|nr:hypothetical protein [Nitratireductor sp.]MCV0349033.1 hypothetical protein [Nitratireductor sp.]
MTKLIETIDQFRSKDALGNIRGDEDISWEDARRRFIDALACEKSSERLEEAVTYKWSWDLPVDLNLKLLKRAKDAGCDSFEFWQAYYKFQAAYLTPSDPDFSYALEMANGKYL